MRPIGLLRHLIGLRGRLRSRELQMALAWHKSRRVIAPSIPLACEVCREEPAGLVELVARTVPPTSAFPRVSAGRLLHCTFRGLLSVHSRYGLHAPQVTKVTLYTGGSDGFVISTAAPIASTEWNEPVLGREFHPLWTSACRGAQHSNTRLVSRPRFLGLVAGSVGRLRSEHLRPR
jgi:hypothetical protein